MEQPEPPTPPTAPVAETTPAPEAEPTPDAPGGQNPPDAPVALDAPDDLAAVRKLILLAYPDVVPELVRGGTIAELQAAVGPARAAYRQVADRIAAGAGSPAVAPSAPPPVPAGAAGVLPPLDGLPPGELIKRGLQRRG
jgi:hypothetical protein